MEYSENIAGPDFVRPGFVSDRATQASAGPEGGMSGVPGEQDLGGAGVSPTGVAETIGAGETQGTRGRAQDAMQRWLADAAQFLRDKPWPALAAAFAAGLALGLPRGGAGAAVASVGEEIRRQAGGLADAMSGRTVGATDSVAARMASSPQSGGPGRGTSASGTVAAVSTER